MPEDVGTYVSALANSAMLAGVPKAFLVFGVEDKTHEIVGTNLKLKDEKVGNEIFENWVTRLLSPRINIEFVEVFVDQKNIQIIAIDPAYISPVKFKSQAYIRVDSVHKNISEYPERERELWAVTSRLKFERGVAAAHLSVEEIFDRFEPKSLLRELGPERNSRAAIIDQLIDEELLIDDRQNGYDVTNLFALLAANNIEEINILRSKAPRVIVYKGNSKLNAEDDVTGRKGYALGFSGLLGYIMSKIPHREEMRHGVRKKVYDIPEISIREFVANALIHQDLTASGAGPVIEIFDGRIKITNPGEPLIEPERFIDAPAKSRNESLAATMRRLGICEERGSGIDRALTAIERQMLAPPLFQKVEGSTVVTVFGRQSFADMSRDDRLRACYQHAALRWESHNPMNNQSLRKRLGLNDKQYSQISRLISEAIEAGLIRPLDETQGNRNAKYVPFWAA
ncbi:MAG: putative DNA binding domain-containing protein [Euryhalocaulis sp.]|nr:putative DNA binding domain-containing protein [Euryhalocaulis sp.]